MQTDRLEGRLDTAAYKVDPSAVADAIVDRLLAGRALTPLRTEDR